MCVEFWERTPVAWMCFLRQLSTRRSQCASNSGNVPLLRGCVFFGNCQLDAHNVRRILGTYTCCVDVFSSAIVNSTLTMCVEFWERTPVAWMCFLRQLSTRRSQCASNSGNVH